MKRALLIAAFLLPLAAHAQTAAVNGWCDLGATQALVSGLKSTNYLQGDIPRCTVTVYNTGTIVKATIYADGSSTPLANPFTATTIGQWLFYASTSGAYDVVLSGGIPPNTYLNPVTLTGVGAGGGGGGGSFPIPAYPNQPVVVNPTGTGVTTYNANSNCDLLGQAPFNTYTCNPFTYSDNGLGFGTYVPGQGYLTGLEFNLNATGPAGLNGEENRSTVIFGDNSALVTPGIKNVWESWSNCFGVGDCLPLNFLHFGNMGLKYGSDQGYNGIANFGGQQVPDLDQGQFGYFEAVVSGGGTGSQTPAFTTVQGCTIPNGNCYPSPGSVMLDTATSSTATVTGASIQFPGAGACSNPANLYELPITGSIPHNATWGCKTGANINPNTTPDAPVSETFTLQGGAGAFSVNDEVCVLPYTVGHTGFWEESKITSVSGSAGTQTITMPFGEKQTDIAIFKGGCQFLSSDADFTLAGLRTAYPFASIDGTHAIYVFPAYSTEGLQQLPISGSEPFTADGTSTAAIHAFCGGKVTKVSQLSPLITNLGPNTCSWTPGDTVEDPDFPSQNIIGNWNYTQMNNPDWGSGNLRGVLDQVGGLGFANNSVAFEIDNVNPDSFYYNQTTHVSTGVKGGIAIAVNRFSGTGGVFSDLINMNEAPSNVLMDIGQLIPNSPQTYLGILGFSGGNQFRFYPSNGSFTFGDSNVVTIGGSMGTVLTGPGSVILSGGSSYFDSPLGSKINGSFGISGQCKTSTGSAEVWNTCFIPPGSLGNPLYVGLGNVVAADSGSTWNGVGELTLHDIIANGTTGEDVFQGNTANTADSRIVLWNTSNGSPNFWLFGVAGSSAYGATPANCLFLASQNGGSGSPNLSACANSLATYVPFTFATITGSTQCLHVSTAGLVSGTGTDCGAGATPSWSALTNPTGNLGLTMGSFSSTFTYGATTGSSDLWKLTDTASNTGTGILGHFTTASGSSEIPWQADANGCGWKISATGTLVSVCTTLPTQTVMTYTTSHAPTGTAGAAVLAPDTAGLFDVNENNTGFSRVCTAANAATNTGCQGSGSGTVTSIATTGPIGGGTITTTGTITCATCVVASSPGAGIAHFAGSTQTVTSSAVSLSADVSGNLPNANLASQTANTVLGALTATTPSGLAVPSCSGATNALIWTSGTGFGCNTISGGGTVTSVGFTGGLITVATATTTPAFTVAGTSGAIPYFSSTSTWASSALLTNHGLMVGGGAGAAPATLAVGGANFPLLGVAASNPAFSTIAYPTSLTSGGILYGSSTTALASSALLTQFGLIYGGGAGATPVSMAACGANFPIIGQASSAPICSTLAYPTSATGSGLLVEQTSPSLITPALGVATATSLLATGNVDGTAPVTITTGSSATLGGTFKSGYTFNQEATAATAIIYTLPTAAAGLQYCVANSWNGSAATTGTLELLTSASGQFIIFTDGTLSATGGFVQSGGAARDSACVVGVDATHWILYPSSGTWTKH